MSPLRLQEKGQDSWTGSWKQAFVLCLSALERVAVRNNMLPDAREKGNCSFGRSLLITLYAQNQRRQLDILADLDQLESRPCVNTEYDLCPATYPISNLS
jgi:hypothetical protein